MILAIGLYIACELVANITAVKPIVVGPVVVPAGVFIYALTFTLLDLINEQLGKARARQVIATAFCANLLLAVYAQVTVWWPAPEFFQGQPAVAEVLGAAPRVVGASLLAYLGASLVDAELFAWWRAHVGGYRWLRVLVSNAVSTGVDSALFVTLAFVGKAPVVPLVVGQYVIKIAVTLVSLPLIYVIRKGPPVKVSAAVALGLVLSAGAATGATRPSEPRVHPGTTPEVPTAVDRVRAAVVGIQARIPPDRPSAATLGTERWGSGVIIAPDGLVLTVGYVVLEAARLDVILDDGRTVPARVVGHDFESGLGVIRLDGGGPYPSARLGRSAPVAAGQPASIVGVTEDRRPVAVAARVIAVRPFVAYWEYMLDRALVVAPLHPAFGGAPLVDPDGALIGVVSLRLPGEHVAIPIDLLLPVREALVAQGRPARPPRPWLGVRALAIDGGIGIAGVSPVGPASAAGLRPGDVIVRLNGERVADVADFYRKLWGSGLGSEIELAVYRDGRLEAVTVRPRDRYRIFQFRTP